MNALRIAPAAVVLGVLLMPACSSLPAPPPDQYFQLVTPPAAAVATSGVRIQVETVEANGVYAERPLLFRQSAAGSAIQQYRYELWAEPPAKMLRNTLVDHLRSQYGAERVWTSEARAPADFIVRGRLRALEQLTQGATAHALLSLDYVVTDPEGTVMAVVDYTEEVPTASASVGDYVAALNQLLARAYADVDRRLAPLAATKK